MLEVTAKFQPSIIWHIKEAGLVHHQEVETAFHDYVNISALVMIMINAYCKRELLNDASPNVLSLKTTCFSKELEALQETSSSERLGTGKRHVSVFTPISSPRDHADICGCVLSFSMNL